MSKAPNTYVANLWIATVLYCELYSFSSSFWYTEVKGCYLFFAVFRTNGSVVETSSAVDKETREFLGKAADGIVSEIFSTTMPGLDLFCTHSVTILMAKHTDIQPWILAWRSSPKIKVKGHGHHFKKRLSMKCLSVIDEASNGRNQSRIWLLKEYYGVWCMYL